MKYIYQKNGEITQNEKTGVINSTNRLRNNLRRQKTTWLWGALVIGIVLNGLVSLMPVAPKAEAQGGTLKLSKEYIRAGSRTLAVEDQGIAAATPTPTP